MSMLHAMLSLAITLVLLTLMSRLYLRLTRSRWSTSSYSSASNVANRTMSSAWRRFVTICPPVYIPPWNPLRVSVITISARMLNKYGEMLKDRPKLRFLTKFKFGAPVSPFSDQGQIRYKGVNRWYVVPCQISPWSVYIVAYLVWGSGPKVNCDMQNFTVWGQKLQIWSVFERRGAPVPTPWPIWAKFGVLQYTLTCQISEEVRTILAPPKHIFIWRVVSPLVVIEIWGKL